MAFIVAVKNVLFYAILGLINTDYQWIRQTTVILVIRVHHRAFVIEAFFENSKSIVARRRLFRVHFNVGRHCAVPYRNTVLKWVSNFRNIASALKVKPS